MGTVTSLSFPFQHPVDCLQTSCVACWLGIYRGARRAHVFFLFPVEPVEVINLKAGRWPVTVFSLVVLASKGGCGDFQRPGTAGRGLAYF